MKHGRKEKRVRQAVRFGQFSSQCQGFLAPGQSLMRFAEKPHSPGGMPPRPNSWILRIAESIIAMPLRIVTQERFLKMFDSRRKLSHVHQRDLHCELRIWKALIHARKFFRDFAGSL